jgi:hypothetical protein
MQIQLTLMGLMNVQLTLMGVKHVQLTLMVVTHVQLKLMGVMQVQLTPFHGCDARTAGTNSKDAHGNLRKHHRPIGQ